MFHLISQDGCHWCDKAIDYIQNELGEAVKVSLCTDNPVTILLMRKAGMKTVPQIWCDGEYVGGYTDLIQKYQG